MHSRCVLRAITFHPNFTNSAYTFLLTHQEVSVHRALSYFGIFVLLNACGQPQATPNRGGPGGFKRPPTLVEVTTAQPRTISDVIEAIGTAQANESVTLSAKVTDTVNKVKFEDGDYVAAGTVLAELTNTEDTALLAEAEANVDDAGTGLDPFWFDEIGDTGGDDKDVGTSTVCVEIFGSGVDDGDR